MKAEYKGFNNNIFINCPFDEEYKRLLQVLLFTIIDFGFEPQITLQTSDSGEQRITKIKKFIKKSRYSVHDISRIELSPQTELPRFNMPFELGLDLGCREYGTGKYKQKKCLILDTEQFRYQQTLSDVAGNDPKAHKNDPETLSRRVRDWMIENTNKQAKFGSEVWDRFNTFDSHLLEVAKQKNLTQRDIDEMPIKEFILIVKNWVKNNP